MTAAREEGAPVGSPDSDGAVLDEHAPAADEDLVRRSRGDAASAPAAQPRRSDGDLSA